MSAVPTQSAPPTYPEKIDGAVLKIAGVVVLGAIMSILDITVVNVALPTFQTTFAPVGHPLPYSTVAWTVTGYTLGKPDAPLTMVVGERNGKVMSWYDNEWGYSCRVVDLAAFMGERLN